MDASACEQYSSWEFLPFSNALWRGSLSEDRATGAPELTWNVYFSGWPDGESSVAFNIESIPFEVSSWRELEGSYAECSEFGEPIEPYLFDGEHSDFEYARIHALRQVGKTVRFAIELDRCEVNTVKVDQDEHIFVPLGRLQVVVDAEFSGISVHTPNYRLTDFIDTSGLVPDVSGSVYRPAGR
ncbi:hypothetical protein [Nocardia paucivorans]|uniref:hypothetical protein n=1 Tax=Nocardia paucivorans TaxID=114259 RepID=UPI000594D063|nr:hypothetical protein [Nocardia paucivorans]